MTNLAYKWCLGFSISKCTFRDRGCCTFYLGLGTLKRIIRNFHDENRKKAGKILNNLSYRLDRKMYVLKKKGIKEIEFILGKINSKSLVINKTLCNTSKFADLGICVVNQYGGRHWLNKKKYLLDLIKKKGKSMQSPWSWRELSADLWLVFSFVKVLLFICSYVKLAIRINIRNGNQGAIKRRWLCKTKCHRVWFIEGRCTV